MAQAWWRVDRSWLLLLWLRWLRRFLRKLSLLYYVLDDLLLATSLLSITPPHWSLIVASQAQVLACLARRFSFLALLPPQSASKAAWNKSVSSERHFQVPQKNDIPERDRLCILDAFCASEDGTFLGAAILAFCFDVVACAEEDMNGICTSLVPQAPMGRDYSSGRGATRFGKDGIGRDRVPQR
jgi:hypothetical protein